MRLILFLLISFLVVGAFAQQPSMSPKMAAANELYRQQRFDEAAKAFEAVTKDEPKNGRAWYFLGLSLHSLKRYREAIVAFTQNVAIVGNPLAMYNIACGFSRLGETDKAFEWLEKAIKAGAAVTIESDPDLENIRKDARFAKMIELGDRLRRPCMYSAEARQFDFWIGDWEVFNPAGQKAGTNTVQLFSDGCGLMENWAGSQGGDGKSINFYDSGTRKWYQSWIGSGGGALRYAGSFADGAMRFEGETIGADGKRTLQKLTFSKIDENTVRQLAETSVDGGKTWVVSYDFKYVRRK
jgi:hypothetical protein